MKIVYLLPVLIFVITPAFAYNSGFQPIYQPNTGGASSVGSIHNVGNVTESGCAENEILKVNSTGFFDCAPDETGAGGESNTASNVGLGHGLFKQKAGVNLEFLNIFCAGDLLCSSNSTDVRISYTATAMGSSALDDLADVIITSPAYLSTLFYNGVEWIDKIFSINSITCGAGEFVNIINNQTGATACGSPSGSGFTNIASAPQTTATILASNSSNTATIKTLTQGQGITLTNGSSAVTVATNFKVNNIDIDCTDSQQLNRLQFDNATGLYTGTCDTDETGSGGGVTTLSGGNLTSSSTASYTTIFTIPLTASSGNFVSAYLIADSEVGTAVQVNANVTGSGNHGTCRVFTPLTISTFETDVLQVGLGSPVDTGTTAWFTNNATAIEMQCAIQSNGSPGNLKINFQTEITNINARILPGSYYIKTP